MHPFPRKHPEDKHTGWRMEYFSSFSSQAAASSYLLNTLITHTQEQSSLQLDRTRQEHSPHFLPKECFIDKFPQSLSIKRNSSTPNSSSPGSTGSVPHRVSQTGSTSESNHHPVHPPPRLPSCVPRAAEGREQGWGEH